MGRCVPFCIDGPRRRPSHYTVCLAGPLPVPNPRQTAKPSIFSGGSAGPGQARRGCGADIPVLVARRVHPSRGELRCSVFEQRLCNSASGGGVLSLLGSLCHHSRKQNVCLARTHACSALKIHQAYAALALAVCCPRCVSCVYYTVLYCTVLCCTHRVRARPALVRAA